MTAIDSRATITCNLGEVISGGISDSYLQNSGLVFTRGQLTLAGIRTPSVGSQVTINYALNSGLTGKIPRNLVVLSSFADPFRQTTEVSVGCKLTYLDGVMPVPSLEDGQAAYLRPRQLECLNGLEQSAFVPPIFADDVFGYCTSKLNIGRGGVTLYGAYMMDRYDLTQGYVSAIANLLLSEGYVGYASETGGLEVIRLSSKPSGGPTLGIDDIIDVSGVNSGEQPASIVIVPYIDKKLEQYEPDDAKWEEVESVGDPESIQLQFSGSSVTVTHTPTTKTITEYGPPVDLTDRCELFDGGYGDLSDTVVKTTTTRSTVLGFAAGGYATALLEEGKSVNTSLPGEVTQITNHEFDEKDRPKRTVTETFEPFFVYAGRMSLQWVFADSYVILGNELVLVERTVEEYEYAGELNIPEGFKPGQDIPESAVYQRIHRFTYQAWGKTQGGSQGPAESTTLEAFANASQVVGYIQGSLGLTLTDSEVQSNKAFNPKGQRRPSETDRAVEQGTLDGKGRETKYVELEFSSDGDASRVVQYSPPHLTESYFDKNGFVVEVDSQSVSAKFGRVQHRLAAGNRLGMNITSTPDKLALAPYSGLRVNAGGFSATYAVNALNFSFGRDGIVASVDALYLGGNGTASGSGGTGGSPPWFYLPPNYNPDDLPEADDDSPIIPPFNERVNVAAGIALGTRAASQLAQGLIPKDVEIGIALGIDGTSGNYKQIVEVGVGAGVEASGTIGFTEGKSIGVKLGVEVRKALAQPPISVGAAIGVNIGPSADSAALLMHFDDLPADSAFSETIWTDSSSNDIQLTNTTVGTFGCIIYQSSPPNLTSRFGEGLAVFGNSDVAYEDRGGILSERTPALNLGAEWTIEFWFLINDLSWPETRPTQPWCLLSMDSVNGTNITFYVKWEDVGGTQVATLHSQFRREGSTFFETLDGAQIIRDNWIHCAMCKTVDGVRLFQNGNSEDSFGWIGLITEQVDRIAIAGLARPEWDDQIKDWPITCMFDELRILPEKAAYDINSPTYEIPTGPFAAS